MTPQAPAQPASSQPGTQAVELSPLPAAVRVPHDGPITIGVDLGGTGIRIVAVNSGGVVLRQQTLPTASPHTAMAHEAVAALGSDIMAVAGSCALAGIGIGASGPIDRRGVIRNDDTLPAYSHVPLTRLLSERFGVPCVIDNDAVAAAIGENAYGAGQRSESLLMVTLGTGIGVAMLTPGGPVRAADGSHPEAGHIAIAGPAAVCYCGLPVCWEQLASRRALDTMTAGRAQELADAMTSPEAAPADFESSRQLFTAYGQRVGAGVATLLTLYHPARVVFGGSAARYLPAFASGLERALSRHGEFTWTPPYAEAALGALSGAIGAAVLARPPCSDGRQSDDSRSFA